MSPNLQFVSRRDFLSGIAAMSATLGTIALSARTASAAVLPSAAYATHRSETNTTLGQATSAAQDSAVRPFVVNVLDADLDDLRRRLVATRLADQETVNDGSQGVQLARFRSLIQYWATDYDWHNVEARLNALPQFVTEIDGLDIQFAHVRSPHPNALPLVMTHGWPGSIVELLNVIDPLTNPTAYGAPADDSFHLVLPSIPGYGFSGKPKGTGWNPERIARAWAQLMDRLGYTRYVAQGGDWGAPISSAMARQAPAGLLGIHVNLPATVPAEVDAALAIGAPAPAGLSEQERAVFDALATYRNTGSTAYNTIMSARPQAIGYGLTDSPAGLAAWILVHPGFAQWTYDNDPDAHPTKDEALDDITLYWLTKTASSSARLYWENAGRGIISAAPQQTAEISLPVAITVFPNEVYRAPETWARRAYPDLIYFHEVDKGGHFAAWEQPEVLAAELRAAFKSLR